MFDLEIFSGEEDMRNGGCYVMTSDRMLNARIMNRIHKPNSKSWMKYYIGKDLYDLFSYAIVWKNIWEIEFFTLNEESSKNIWDNLNVYRDYGRVKLVDSVEYDDNYQCYTISVFCPDLIMYLKSCNDYVNPFSEVVWKNKALNCGWSKSEVDEGYIDYKKRCDAWFERHYGRHIKGLGGIPVWK